MNWNDIRMLLAVVRAAQFRRAAQRLNMTQATLSRRIARLETQLGVNLLIREPHGCRLSDEGLAMLPKFEAMEEAALAVNASGQRANALIEGTIRIGTPDGFGVAFLAPLMADLAVQFPLLQIQLVPISRNFSLSQREADLAIMVGRPDHGKLVRKKLTDYSLGLFAAPGYIAKWGQPVSSDDLENHRLIGYVEDLVASTSLNYMQEFSRQWRSSLEVSNAIGQLEAVRAGAGIGILHHFMLARAPNLVPVLPEKHVTRSYWIAWHESLNRSDRVQAVVQFITAQVELIGRRYWLGQR